eukprot:1495063-Pleurochrysis_carterae.AAC.3
MSGSAVAERAAVDRTWQADEAPARQVEVPAPARGQARVHGRAHSGRAQTRAAVQHTSEQAHALE